MVTNNKTFSANGRQLLTQLEGGCRLKAYPDVKGVWTIAVGVTFYPDGMPVKQGDTCTQSQANVFVNSAVQRFVNVINKVITVPLTQNQFDALVIFVYNIGTTSFLNGSVDEKLNACDYTDAMKTWASYCNIRDPNTGKLVPNVGLKNRRAAEIKLFNTP